MTWTGSFLVVAGLLAGALGVSAAHNLSTTSTVLSEEGARLACRHLLLVCESSHPLAQRVANGLRKTLQHLPIVEQLDYAEPGTSPPAPFGSRGPDIFLRVDLAGAVAAPSTPGVTASLGSAPWQSSYWATDNKTPPLVAFHWTARLDQKRKPAGRSLENERLDAEELIQALTRAITTQLRKIHAHHASLPPLPGILYGPFKPAPRIGISALERPPTFSYCGLFTHNQTFWQFHLRSNPVQQLERVIEQLKDEQWKLERIQLTRQFRYLAMQLTLVVFGHFLLP
ncbi:MAG: hypothetical protein AB9869_12745 [Verrucomicrobiia bacterium]